MISIGNMEKKTKQIGLRLDIGLLEDIKEIARLGKVDPMLWIKRTLSDQARMDLYELKYMNIDNMNDEFIHLRITAEELKKALSIKKIPSDIINARKEVLKKMVDKKVSVSDEENKK